MRAIAPRAPVHTSKVDGESQPVRMRLIGGRHTIRFDVPASNAAGAGYPTASADLLFRHGRWWLRVVVTAPAPTDPVVGVDRGRVRPVVTSTNRVLGNRAPSAAEGRLVHRKRALHTKGTQAAKRHLKRVRGTPACVRRTTNPLLCTQIVAAADPGATMVLETVTALRKRPKIRTRTETSCRVQR